jgi:uncharacterized alkaline shock family protein YloU
MKWMSFQIANEWGKIHTSNEVIAVIAGSAALECYGLVVSYGTKISEVALNVQNRVKYVLNEIIGLDVQHIHIIVQGVRVIL